MNGGISQKRQIPEQKISRKTKNKMEGRCPERCITDARNTRMEETRWGLKSMEVPFKGRSEHRKGCNKQYTRIDGSNEREK